jgi:hypothetical protein
VYLHVLLNAFIHTVMYTYYFVSMHTKVRVPRLDTCPVAPLVYPLSVALP